MKYRFLINDLTILKKILLCDKKVWTENRRWFVGLISQNEPNVRNVLLSKLNLAAGKHLQAHLQVVAYINKWILKSN